MVKLAPVIAHTKYFPRNGADHIVKVDQEDKKRTHSDDLGLSIALEAQDDIHSVSGDTPRRSNWPPELSFAQHDVCLCYCGTEFPLGRDEEVWRGHMTCGIVHGFGRYEGKGISDWYMLYLYKVYTL